MPNTRTANITIQLDYVEYQFETDIFDEFLTLTKVGEGVIDHFMSKFSTQTSNFLLIIEI